MFHFKSGKFFTIIFLALFFASCSKTVQLRFSQPAEVQTGGIKTVAVANFQIMEIKRISSLERNGKWQSRSRVLSSALKQAIAKQVRGKVINLLSTSPSFELIYADEFAQLEDDAAIQDMVASAGFKAKKVDAIISGKVWIDVNDYDGSDINKLTLKYVLAGGEGQPAYSVDSLVYWPYKSVKGSLALEIKMTRTDPTEVIAVVFDQRSFGAKIGGRPANLAEQIANAANAVQGAVTKDENEAGETEIEESDLVLPNFTQLISDMSESVAARFAKKISISEKQVTLTIAEGGDEQAIPLIKANAFERAIKQLNAVSANNNPADKYNLALSYEAIGEYGLASVLYDEALTMDSASLTFAEGVGRIERLKREFRQVKVQLQNK